jgi:tRNA threonylcarbamoyladenosine biosynthesis protein TsaE
MALKIEVNSPAETAALASALAGMLEAGDVVFLEGPLGAGKSFFVREAASALGVKEPVTSPSYTLAQAYRGKMPVNHLDLYRLEGFGRDDYADFEAFFDADAVTFVEWPEPLAGIIDSSVTVTIEHHGGDRRLITVRGHIELEKRLEAALGGTGA